MSEADLRDDRLAEILDRAVRGLDPRLSPDRAMRKGDLRRVVRLAASIGTVMVFIIGAVWAAAIVGDHEATPVGTPPIVTFASPEALWTFEYPSAWEVATEASAGPGRIGNVLRTTIANGRIPTDVAFGPNSGPDDALVGSLGDAGAVVLVQRTWSHATPLGDEEWGPRPFADDASNPGWTFRERARCDGTLCFQVVEWLGPAVTAEDRSASAAIAGSVRLAGIDRWTETDGVRTTLHDESDLFTVTYPSDWHLSDVPIQPDLSSPFEILALATYPLRPGGEAVEDFQLPSHAVEDLGPNDILIWMSDAGTDGAGAPQRPERFGPLGSCGDLDGLCPTDGRDMVPGIRGWWMYFQDSGRALYVFVGMGEEAFADPARAQLAWDVLDSLRFLPR